MSNLRGGDTIGGYPIPGMFGTNGKIAKFNGSLITDSIISEVGGNIGINTSSPTYGYHQIGRGLRLQGLEPPVVTPTVNGVTGATTHTYFVFVRDANGFRGYPTTVTVTNCNATMNATNSVTLSWPAVVGAVSYDICKNSYGTSLVTNLTATSFTDTGQALVAYTTQMVDESASLTMNGQLVMFGNYATGTTASRLQYRVVMNDGGGRVNELINVAGSTVNGQTYHATTSEPAMKIVKDPNGDLFTIYTAPAGVAPNPITWTRRLRMTPYGNMYIGDNDGVSIGSTARRYLSVQGTADAGILELSQYSVADAAGVMNGQIQFADSNNTAAEKRTAGIVGYTDTGTTANARGGKLSFYTRADGAGGTYIERGHINSSGLFTSYSAMFIGTDTSQKWATNRKMYVLGTDGSGTNSWADDVDRPGVFSKGSYPEINLVSNAANTSHGATLRFTGYTDGNKNTWKHWTLGTPGQNAWRFDIGYAVNDVNPHAGLSNWVGGSGTGKTVATFTEDGGMHSNYFFRPSAGSGYQGITWADNIGGGSGDGAFIRYYIKSGEDTRLHIGALNDANDDIYLATGSASIVVSNKVWPSRLVIPTFSGSDPTGTDWGEIWFRSDV